MELPVRVNGVEQVIYFASKDCALRPSDEALVSATLLPCMVAGYDYPRPLRLSPQFQEALPAIQDIYRAWLPESRGVTIPCAAPVEDAEPGEGDQVVAFFTCGVDSFDTLLKHQDEITHLCLIYGMDIAVDNIDYQSALVAQIRKVGVELGKELIEVETNIAPFLDNYVTAKMGYGTVLRTIGMLLEGFAKVYIPASCSAAYLVPDGTHPAAGPALEHTLAAVCS